jgi:hypothetical protein
MRRGAHLAVSSTETVTGSGNIVNNTADNAPDSGDWEQEKDLAPKHCKLDTPPPGMCVPAINIEHAVLRMGGFLGLIVSCVKEQSRGREATS